VLGDFNARTGCLKDTPESEDSFRDSIYVGAPDLPPRSNQDLVVDSNGIDLVELCLDNELFIVNGRFQTDLIGSFTCYPSNGSSTVDYILASYDILPQIKMFMVDVLDKSISDVHCATSLELEYGVQPKNSKVTEQVSVKTVVKWDSSKKSQFTDLISGDKSIEFLQRLSNIDSNTVSKETIEELSDTCKDIFHGAAQACGMSKKVTFKQPAWKKPRESVLQPWFNEECENQRKILFTAKNKARREGTTDSATAFVNISRAYKKLLKRTAKVFNDDFQRKLRSLRTKNPRMYWKAVGDKPKSSCPIDIATLFEHFSKLTGSDEANTPDLPDTSEQNVFINQDFTREEVGEALNALKNNKSGGADNIINEFLKNAPEVMICIITQLFNIILKSGHIPEDWAVATLVPLYKGSLNGSLK
jgi:hypothetical protein